MSSHRFYANEFPKVDDVVMVKVMKYVIFMFSLRFLESPTVEYTSLCSSTTASKDSSLHLNCRVAVFVPSPSLSRLARWSPALSLVLMKRRVGNYASCINSIGYVDLSKRRVAEDDVNKAERKYQEAKKVHNIASVLSNRSDISLDDVYTRIIWPLAEKYQSGYNAFMISVRFAFNCRFIASKPEILQECDVDETVRKQLQELIITRMAPQAQKVRADIEATCFSIQGVDGLRAAMASMRCSDDV